MNMMNSVNCPSDDQLEAILFLEDLDPTLEWVCEHVEVCGVCSERADNLLRLRGTFGRMFGELLRDELLDTGSQAHVVTVITEPEDVQSPEHPVANGKIIGKHRVLGQIGSGGMGEVYLCEHVELKTLRAMKVISESRREATEALIRFRREYEVAGQLNHPHLIRTIDAGEHDGLVYLIMDYVEGANLSQIIERGEHLSVPDACEILRQAAEGLHGLIQSGYVHRDIKPANIMIRVDGRVFLLDYGLARAANQGDPREPSLTGTFQIVGSLNYMAPELFSNSNLANERSDLYSLGCTAYQLLTGTVAHQSDVKGESRVMEILQKHQNETYQDIQTVRPDLPDPVAEVVRRLMSVKPEERFEDVVQFIEAITPHCKPSGLSTLVSKRPLDLGPLPNHLLAERLPMKTQIAGAQSSESRRLRVYHIAMGLIVLIAAISGLLLTGTSDVRIETNGRPTKIEVDGSATRFRVDEDGNIRVRLENGSRMIRVKFANNHTLTQQKWILRYRDNHLSLRVDPSFQPSIIETVPGDARVGSQPPTTPQTESQPPFGGEQRPERKLPTLQGEIREFPDQAPLSAAALIQRPRPIDGVLSWTIETKTPRGEINSLRFNHDRSRLAIGGSDGTVRVYQTDDMSLRFVLIGHVNITSIRWVTRDAMLVASEDGIVRLWDVSRDEYATVLRTWSHDGTPVWDADLSPDGHRLAVAAAGKSRIHSLDDQDSGSPISGYCWACAWSNEPSSSILAMGNSANLRLVDQEDGEQIEIPGDGSRIQAMDWQPGGRYVASSSHFGDPIRVYDTRTHEVKTEVKLPRKRRGSVRWSPDGQRLCGTDASGFAILDMETLEVATVDPNIGEFGCLDWYANDEIFAVRRFWPKLMKVNLKTGTNETILPVHNVGGASLNWDDPSAMYYCGDRAMFRVNADGVIPFATPEVSNSFNPSCFVRFDKTKESFFFELDRKLYVTQKLEGVFDEIPIPPLRDNVISASHPSETLCLFVYPDGTVTQVDSTLKPTSLPKFDRASSQANVKWSPDGKRIAFVSGGDVFVWKSMISEENRIDGGILQGGSVCAWSSDSQRLAVSSFNGIRLFDFSETPTTTTEIPIGQKHWRNDGMAFSPDDTQLVIRTDTSLEVWDTETWKLLQEVPTNVNFPKAPTLIWSPDGTMIGSATIDGVVRFYRADELATAGNLLLLTTEKWATFTPSGEWYATDSIRDDLIVVFETEHGQTMYPLSKIAELESKSPLIARLFE